jgi:hypothetical protein
MPAPGTGSVLWSLMQNLIRRLAAVALSGAAVTGSGGAELRMSAPGGTGGDPFEAWAGARSYLGRTFEDIRVKESFEIGADNFGSASMRKKAFVTSPEITVTDNGRTRRLVSSVSVFQASPSEDFLGKLVASLSARWGAPSGTDLATGVTWSSPAFTGVLKLERVSPTGPYVTLKLDSR